MTNRTALTVSLIVASTAAFAGGSSAEKRMADRVAAQAKDDKAEKKKIDEIVAHYDKREEARKVNDDNDKLRIANVAEADKVIKEAESAVKVKDKCKEAAEANDYLRATKTPKAAPFDNQAKALVMRLKAIQEQIKKDTSFSCAKINIITELNEETPPVDPAE